MEDDDEEVEVTCTECGVINYLTRDLAGTLAEAGEDFVCLRCDDDAVDFGDDDQGELFDGDDDEYDD
jgi:hypothetical protein